MFCNDFCNIKGTCKKDHFQQYLVCGKPVLWNSARPVPSCSKECKKEPIRRRNVEKYGVDNPRKFPEVIKRMQQTKLKRYGTAGPDLEKLRRTTNERYGVDYYTQSEEYKKKYNARHNNITEWTTFFRVTK